MASFRLAASCLLFVTFLLEARSSVIRYNEHEPSEEPVKVHSTEWEDEDDPSAMLAYIHSPNEKELAIHHLSRNLLIVTKDLLSYEPRTKSPGRYLGTDEKLSLLRSLKPEDVKNLLSHHSISVPPTSNLTCGANELYYRTMDGSCNNLVNPCWGKTDEPYTRWLPPAYANGLDEPRKMKSGYPLPSPRLINQWVSSQFEPSPETTYPSFTNLIVVWGQMIAHDILLTPTVTIKVWNGTDFKNERPQCCKTTNPHPECFPIVMNYEDGYFPSGHCMNIARSSAYMYSPYSCSSLKLGKTREQMNQLTSFIDASIVYGVTEEDMRKLRDNGGLSAKLIMDRSTGWSYPTRKEGSTCKASSNSCSKKCFLTGEKRANENPVLGAMHTLFAREHNRLVDLLRVKGWPEEMLFHVVRKIVGAMLQHTTYKEYLPLVVGPTLSSVMKLNVPTENYKYDPSVNPTLYNAFVTAAFRYGHSMVSTRHERAEKSLQDSPVLSKDFFSMDDFCNPPTDQIANLLNGQIRQKVQKVDCLFSKQITNHLFAKEVNGKGLDLFAVNVQRGRDHGIPPYNEWRKVCGLPAATDYADLKGIMPDYIVDRLEKVYGPGNVDEIDLYVGGISEFAVNDGILGPTFTCIVANQFRNLKLGDRFWYENLQHPGAFSRAQIASIQKTTIASLICRNTDTKEIPQLALILESVYNPKVSCASIMQQTDLDLRLW